MLGWLRNLVRGQDQVEKRASASGFTAEIIAARESYISGRRGIAELTATAQACISMWENGFSMADVEGTDLLDRRSLALDGRSVPISGEAVFLMRCGLIPASDGVIYTRHGSPGTASLRIDTAPGVTDQHAPPGEAVPP